MRKFICVICTLLLASCSSVLTDIASFKDPDFENREPVKVMALIVNNTTMQNINRVQFALNELLKEENIDVKFLDHYLINPPTRTLSEKDLRKSLTTKWGADALLFVNVISETGKVKGVDGDYVDADEGLKEKGKSDKYTTIAYGKYTASLLDVKTWRTIWKADLIAIDEKFKNTKAMYRLAAEKIILDLLDKKLLSIIKDKNKNNITEYDKKIINSKNSENINDDISQSKETVTKKNKTKPIAGVLGAAQAVAAMIAGVHPDNKKTEKTDTKNKDILEESKNAQDSVDEGKNTIKLEDQNNEKEKLNHNPVEIRPLNKINNENKQNVESLKDVDKEENIVSEQSENTKEMKELDQKSDSTQSIFR